MDLDDRLDGVQLGLAQIRSDLTEDRRRDAERLILKRFAEVLVEDCQTLVADRLFADAFKKLVGQRSSGDQGALF